MFLRFSHVMVYSQKLALSIQWYREKLGFEVDYYAPDEYASLHHPLLGRLAIHSTATNQSIGKGPMPYLLCEDIDLTVLEMRKKGIEVSEPEREGESPKFADFKDLDGNIWGVEEV